MSKKIRLGILGCAEIAFRRFMPAIKNVEGIEVITVAEEYDPTKLETFCQEYNLERNSSFEEIISRKDIDAVYIPQPPSLHYKWAKKALQSGKHVLLEKPSTNSYELTKELVEIARKKKLALHENYMFTYHSQIREIKELIDNKEIGDIRLIRANFGFPMRAQNDFRYNKELGGGALLDAGGYTVKLATLFLGDSVKVDTSKLISMDGFEVDMYGNATLSNDENVVCQVGFGMDCQYQCNLEIWGSKGKIYTDRIFTAPSDYKPKVFIEYGNETKALTLNEDSHFQHSIEKFCEEVFNEDVRENVYREIIIQAKLVEKIKNNN